MAIEKVVLSPLGLNLLHSVKFAINLSVNHFFFKNHWTFTLLLYFSNTDLKKLSNVLIVQLNNLIN